MSDGLEEYLQALNVQQQRERAQEEVINAYTKLADAYAEAQKRKFANPPEPEETPEKRSGSLPRIPPSITGSRAPTPQRAASSSSSQLRTDLMNANKTIHDLNMQAASFKDEIETLKNKATVSDKRTGQLHGRIAKLEGDRSSLNRKLKDRDGELKEKNRMMNEMQDEMVGMEMQMNMAEERAKKLEKDNQDLVERWMKKMGGEADEMNRGSGWK
ncbi:MAG: hypothetical protein Q9162_006093 [Coniocarpon cinnabarinum]